MSREPSTSASKGLRALLESGATGPLSDAQLLRRYVDRRAEAESAFEALVDRHGPMVWGVCRRALGRSPEAEDAFQATFLILARRAEAVRVDGSLGRWLYGVASKVAIKARIVGSRRLAREGRGLEVEPSGLAPDPERVELLQALDEELGRLPEKYRSPMVLCHLEGLTYAESAERLGCPPGAIKGRLVRGRELLRARLARRGLGLPDSAAGASILVNPRPAVPPLLAGSIARAASPAGSGRFVGPSTTAFILAKGALRTMFMTRLAKILLWMAPTSAGLAFLAARPAPEAVVAPPPVAPGPALADQPDPSTAIAVPLPARDDLHKLLGRTAEEAIILASKVPQPGNWTLTTIAQAQASAGDLAGARETFAAAAQEAGGEFGGQPYARGLWRVGHFQAEAGLRDEARSTLRRAAEACPGVVRDFNKDHWTLMAFAVIVQDQARLGDRDEALRTAGRLKDFAAELFVKSETGNAEEVVSADLAGALASVDDFEGAFRRAGTAFETDRIAGSAALSAAKCLDRDKARRFVDKAVALMAKVEWADWKYHGLSDLAEAQARIGDFEGAKRSAREIGEGPTRVDYDMTDGQPYAMIRIAGVQLKAGQVEAARETWREAYRIVVDHPKMRGPKGRFLQVAGGQVVAGDLEGALRSVESMPEGRRAETLAWIARAQAIDGRGEDARKTIDRALADARSSDMAPPKPIPGLVLPEGARPFSPSRAAAMQLAETQAVAGDVGGALKTLGALDDENDRRFTLEKIVSARASAGDVKGALDLATRGENTIQERRSALQAVGQGVEARLRMESP